MMSAIHRLTPPAVLAAALLLVLCGCTDLKLVNVAAVEQEEDPRENIQLRGMSAEMTSGSLVEHRLHSTTAVLVMGADRQRLDLGDMDVETYSPEGELQSVTRAKFGSVFLTEAPERERERGDLELSRVEYRVPAADNASTDAIRLTTDKLLWDSNAGLFRSPTFYRMTMQSPNGMEFVALGDGFTVTRDMSTWNVKHGGLGSGIGHDMRAENAERGAEARQEADSRQAEAEARQVRQETVAPQPPSPGGEVPPASQPGVVVDPSGRKRAVIPAPPARPAQPAPDGR